MNMHASHRVGFKKYYRSHEIKNNCVHQGYTQNITIGRQ